MNIETKYQCSGCSHTFLGKLPTPFLYTCVDCETESRCAEGIAVKMGKPDRLPEDLSLIETGNTCEWLNEVYEILGRIRINYSEGFYRNQWLLRSGQNTYKWLIEAYAHFAIVDFQSLPINTSLFTNTAVGTQLKVKDNKFFFLHSISEIESLQREGQTPLTENKVKGTLSLELLGDEEEWVIIDVKSKKEAEIYSGKVTELKLLKLKANV